MTRQLAKLMHNEFPMLNDWDVLFRNFFDNDSFFTPALNAQVKYPMDIHEDEKSLNIEIAVAGLNKEDISITECGGLLRISYDKEGENDAEGKHYIQKSIAKRSFNFGWKISEKFDCKKIEASMEKGILRISIPKTEEKAEVFNRIEIK